MQSNLATPLNILFPDYLKDTVAEFRNIVSLYRFAWKRWAVTWLTLSVEYSLAVHLFNQLTFIQALSNTKKTLLMKITASCLCCCMKNIPAEVPGKTERIPQTATVMYRLPCTDPCISPTELCTESSDWNLVAATIHTHTSGGLQTVLLFRPSLESTFSLVAVVKHANLNMSGDLVSCRFCYVLYLKFFHCHLMFLPSLPTDESRHICLIVQPAPFSIANIPFLTPSPLQTCALIAVMQ